MKVIKHKDRWYLQSDTGYKEILLSTDTELQKDGVQKINEEFLHTKKFILTKINNTVHKKFIIV
jgi:hypothetical protein